jgi:Fe-S oxidoreductase
VLGPEERCGGSEVRMLGEKRIFEMLVERNLQLFGDLGVTKIVTLSPHAFNTFKNYYPPKFEVFHYTQLLCQLIKEGRLELSKELNAKVTYHDPCFLGRHNSEYQAPRDILNAIPGSELLEMERNRENAFCCGGGSGNFYVDFFGGGENSPARSRIREAYEIGANILAVACPACMTMLYDALKGENLEDKLLVQDISEIVQGLL